MQPGLIVQFIISYSVGTHDSAIKLMLERYDCRSLQEHDQALREILQEVALVGYGVQSFLSMQLFMVERPSGFFMSSIAFQRILISRCSLLNPKWSWGPYGEAVKKNSPLFGFEVTFVEKEKKAQTAIKSAFLKTQTVQELLKIGVHSDILKGIHKDSMIRIKVEIDTDPPLEYGYEQKFLSQPVPVSIKCVDEESLFACKTHAALFRAWKGRVKGRDWYDLVWFIRKKIPLNLPFFSKLTGQEKVLDRTSFLKMVNERIDQLDIPAAIEDIIYFVRDQEAIKRTWSKEFFRHWTEKILTIDEAN